MCGICGFSGIDDKNLLYRMVNTLSHRGPDDEGFYFYEDAALAHKRLSIIDLVSGKQPICDDRGRYFIVFNGEIYNYKELKKDLEKEGVNFKTNSDTEVVLYTYIVHGAHGFLKFNGIWAFAIYDKLEDKLILCRDHAGIKPLYYHSADDKLIFASEIKAILEYKGYSFKINYNAVDDYLALRYVCGEDTIFSGIKQLPAGCILVFKDHRAEVTKYWDYAGVLEKSVNSEVAAGFSLRNTTFAAAQDEFENLLSRAVKNQLLSDVPLGVYLSGGVDSSVIAALMKEHGTKITSFSVGFGSGIDEIEQARKISGYLGADHADIMVTEDDFADLPKAVWHLDQPIGDAIILALFKLSSLASKKVKVVLTGEGADELLGGYVHQKTLYTALNYFRRGVRPYAPILSFLVKLIPEKILNKLFNYPAKLGEEGKQRVAEFIKNMGSKKFSDKYLSLASLFSAKDKERLYTDEFKEKIKDNTFFADEVDAFFAGDDDTLDKIFKFEFKYWLPDNILMKQDKLAMAHGLEARVPYLEPEIISFFDNLPMEIRKQFFNNKSMLKNIFKKYIPEKLLSAKKRAFHVPLETRFKGAFNNIIEEYLNRGIVKKRGYFNYGYVQELKDNLHKSPFLTTKKLMSLAILEMWQEVFEK